MQKLFKKSFAIALGFILVLGSAFAQTGVKVTSTGGTSTATYTTLNGAVTAINAGTHTGDITALFLSSTTETASSTLLPSGSGSASYTSLLISVDPSATSPVTVTSAVADRVLHINGSNVTVDGRKNQTGTNYDLQLSLTAAAASGFRVLGITGFPISNVSIRWVKITGLGATHTGSGIFLGSAASTSAISTVSAIKNWIVGTISGITIGSAASPNNTSNVTISGNKVQNIVGTGIQLNSDGTAGGTITATGNEVFHSTNTASTAGSVFAFSMTGTANNTTYNISGNNVHDLQGAATTGNPAVRAFNFLYTNGTTGTVGATGLTMNFVNNYVNLPMIASPRGVIVNAMFINHGGLGAAGGAGTFNYYHNTIVVSGTSGTAGFTGSSTATRGVGMIYASSNSTVNFFNNLINVTRTGGGTGRHFAYAIPINNYVSGAATVANTGSQYFSNNNVYAQGVGTAIGQLLTGAAGALSFGSTATSSIDITIIQDFLDDTYSPGSSTHDVNSNIYTAAFASTTSPVFSSAENGNTNLIGATTTGVTTDYFGTTRGTPPYIGAYESATPFPHDLAVTQLYSLGRIPYPYAFPHVVKVLVKNTGPFTEPASTATLTTTGANSITKTASVPALAPFASAYVSFPAITTSDITTPTGTQTLTVTLDNDDVLSNNTISITQDLSVNSYGLGYRVPPATSPVANGGVGFNGGTGDFVAKFLCSQASEVNQVKVYFNSTGGQPYNVLIFADDNTTNPGQPGTLLYTSPTYTSVTAATAFDTKDILPSIPVNGNFFIGLRQSGTINLSFAYQSENPPRDASFFFSSPAGSTSWTDFSPGSPFKFLIEPRLRASDDLTANTIESPAANACYTGSNNVTVKLTNSGANVADFSVNPVTVTATINLPNGATATRSTTITTGTLAKDASMIVNTGSITFNNNGTHTINATVNYTADLISDNNSTPTKTILVSRASAYPVSINFSPTGTVPTTLPVTRDVITGSTNWVFASNVGSPALFPLTGTGVLTWSGFNAVPNASARTQLPCLTMPVAAFPVLQFYMSQDNVSTNGDSLRVLLSSDGGATYNFHSNYARFNAGGNGWRIVKINLPQIANLRIALDAKASSGAQNTGRDIGVHNIQIYDCGSGGLWLGSNSDWFDGNNWCSGTVPTASTNVLINPYDGNANPSINATAVAKNLTIGFQKSLTLTSAATSLTVNGDFSKSSSGTFTDNSSAGTIVNGGSFSSQTTAAPIKFSKLTLQGNTSVKSGSAISVAHTLKLDETSGSATFTNNGSVTLVSTTAQTANLAEVGNNSSIVGNITVERAIPSASPFASGSYHHIATPIIGKTINSVFATLGSKNPLRYATQVINGFTYNPNVWVYNALSSNITANGWEVPANGGNTSLAPGSAARIWFNYRFFSDQVVPYDLTGKFNTTGIPFTGSKNLDLAYCATGNCTYTGNADNGFNLVGNPYPSAISWYNIAKSTVDDAIWVWNGSTASYGSFIAGVGVNGQTEIIPSGCGFMVRANDIGGTLGFTESSKVSNTTTAFLRTTALTLFRVSLSNSSTSATDETAIVFRSNATRGYDAQFDASKLSGSILNVSTQPIAGLDLGINSMPSITNSTESLVLAAGGSAAGTYTLHFGGFQSWDPATTMVLKDNFLNTTTTITDGMAYNFVITNNPASSVAGRFVITYTNSVTALAGAVVNKPSLLVYPNPAAVGQEINISVSNMNSETAKLTILDVVGRVVYSSSMNLMGTQNEVKAIQSNLKSGVYTVSLQGSFGRMTQKVTIQ